MKINKIFLLIILILIIGTSMIFAQNVEPKKFSVAETRLILMKSVILPGWGEHSIDHHKRGYIFNSTELLGWLSFAAFTIYNTQTHDDMKAFASDHAGINPSEKDNQYYTDIGNYIDIYAYNDQKRRYRQIDKIYDTENMFWAWDSDKNKTKFDKMRFNSRLAKRNASLVISSLILNRLLSVIDIATLTKGKVDNPYLDNLDTSILPERNQLTMSLNFRF